MRDTAKVVVWHMGLPCGTCSRAREIKLDPWSPAPLRDAKYPLGFPWNSETDAKKVQMANELYTRAFLFAATLISLGHLITIENPTRSWLWELPIIFPILAQCFFVHLHACMFGGLRRKKTSLLTNESSFQSLQRFCDGSHEHAEWGRDENFQFNTAKEAQYPQGFCDAYCEVLQSIIARSCQDYKDHPVEQDSEHFRPFSQPKGRKIQQLVREFAAVHSLVLDVVPKVNQKRLLTHPVKHVPAGAKLLRTEAKRGGVLCIFGIFHSMQQFVGISKSLLHPFDEFVNVPDILLTCMFNILRLGPVQICKSRLKTILEWKRLGQSLEQNEKELHKQIPKHLKVLMRDKKFLMLQKLASDMDWPDKSLHEEMINGFRLVGKGTKSGVFKAETKHASLSEEDLLKKAKFIRPMVLGRISNSEQPEWMSDLQTITRSEADDKGWLEGPKTYEEVCNEMGDDWIPVQRFAVKQKNKLRPIDNFAENRVNDAWEAPEKLDLHALDQLTWIIGLLCKWSLGNGTLDIPLKDGSRLTGKVHHEWNDKNMKCVISTIDLKDAYKQFGIHEKDRAKAVVTLKSDATAGMEHYVMNCLPFGACAAVHHFNRISRMIWAIGVTTLNLPWVNYFDGYPIMSPNGIESSTMSSSKALLKLLGFSFAENKLEPFGETAEVLGVVVDCRQVHEGRLIYSMKESRRAEAMQAIETMLEKGHVVPCTLPSALGRLQFADGQLAGRAGKLAMADVRTLGLESKERTAITTEVNDALKMLLARFKDNKPKSLHLHSEAMPVIIFTDGSYEPTENGETAMVGGVLLDGDNAAKVFGCHVPPALLREWRESGKEHLIGQVELYAVALARELWKMDLKDRRAIIFIDNWPVIDCYVPGTAKQKSWRKLLLCIERTDLEAPSQIWATRVPSESNIADPPSRGSLEPLQFLAPLVVEKPTCPVLAIPLVNCI